MSRVWFITGATRGMDAEIAKAALAGHNNVIATGHRPETVTKALGTSENLLAADSWLEDVGSRPGANPRMGQTTLTELKVVNASYDELD